MRPILILCLLIVLSTCEKRDDLGCLLYFVVYTVEIRDVVNQRISGLTMTRTNLRTQRPLCYDEVNLDIMDWCASKLVEYEAGQYGVYSSDNVSPEGLKEVRHGDIIRVEGHHNGKDFAIDVKVVLDRTRCHPKIRSNREVFVLD